MSTNIKEMRIRELEELIACCGIDPNKLDVEAIVREVIEECRKQGLYPRTA
jgi:hypothetical protein